MTAPRRWSFGLRALLLAFLLCGPLALGYKWLTAPPPESPRDREIRQIKERINREYELIQGAQVYGSLRKIENKTNAPQPAKPTPSAAPNEPPN